MVSKVPRFYQMVLYQITNSSIVFDASGSFIIVGCPYEDLNDLEDVGFVSIFYYNGTRWDDGLKITPDDVEEFSTLDIL